MEFWFGKQSLLIFDLRQQKCLAIVETSHFYGFTAATAGKPHAPDLVMGPAR